MIAVSERLWSDGVATRGACRPGDRGMRCRERAVGFAERLRELGFAVDIGAVRS